MSGPLVTVVTPTYNVGWRLQRCLESVATQTYREIEHLVVDGASTDGTVEALRDSPVRWVSEPDDGQSNAINKGFELGTGSVLTWLNADDVLLPHAVELAVETLRSSGAGWTYGDVRVVGDGRERTFRPPARITAEHFRVTNPLAQPGTFFSRQALDDAGPLAADLHYSMDVDLWLRLLRAGHTGVHAGGVQAVFEVHAASKGGSVSFAEFAFETGLACLRNGYPDLGAAYIGRAAAHSAVNRDGTAWADVEFELDRLLADGRTGPVDRAPAERSARAQLALLGLRRRPPTATTALLRPSVWQDATARALLLNTLTRLRRRPG